MVLEQLGQTDLQPSPHVNALFTELVAEATNPQSPVTHLPTELLHRVRAVCGAGETNLERHWAKQIIANPTELQHFPYLENYRQMLRSEGPALARVIGPGAPIAFVGSGPLPLTAILLARSGFDVTILDSDAEAVKLGDAVITITNTHETASALLPGAPNPIRSTHCAAEDHDYSHYSAVVVAALVGASHDATYRILQIVAKTLPPHGLLAARSVPLDGRRLLYPRLDPTRLDGLDLIGETIPTQDIINSLVLLRPKFPARIPAQSHGENLPKSGPITKGA